MKMEVKLRRRSTMSTMRRPGVKRSESPRRRSTTSLPQDRESMLVMEANEIANCLQKDYAFTKESVVAGDDQQSTVKVLNRKWGISCIWSMVKLKERLQRMRKLIYESDAGSMEGEAVFFDPNDTWIKDGGGQSLSPDNSLICIPSQDFNTQTPPHHPPNQPDPSVRRVATPTRTPAPSRGKNNQSPAATRTSRAANSQSPLSAPAPSSTRSSASPQTLKLKRAPQKPARQTLPAESQKLDSSTTVNITKSEPLSVKNSLNQDDNDDVYKVKARNARNTSALRNGLKDVTKENRDCIQTDSLDYVPEKDTSTSTSSTTVVNGGDQRRNEPLLLGSTELPADSMFLMSTTTSSEGSILPDKYLTESPRREPTKRVSGPVAAKPVARRDAASQTESTTNARCPSALSLCTQMVATLRNRLQGASKNENIVDKVLMNAEAVKVAVINIFEGFTQSQDVGESIDQFGESEIMKYSSIQLSAALELLVSNTTQWLTLTDDLESTLTSDLRTNIITLRSHITGEVLAFLQGCECEDENGVQESAGRIIDLVYDLSRQCGELSVALATPPTVLHDELRESICDLLTMKNNEEVDLLSKKPADDIRQHFLDGCDRFLNRTLDGNMATVDDLERQARDLSLQCHVESNPHEASIKHIVRGVAKTKQLLKSCKQLQAELNSNMRDDCPHPANFFHSYYCRSVSMTTALGGLSGNMALLLQATETTVKEPACGSMRRVSRCTELVLKAISRFIAASNTDVTNLDNSASSVTSSSPIMNGHATSSGITRSETPPPSSVLSDDQCERVEAAGNDARSVLESLIGQIKDSLVLEDGSKSRRMLPVTPGGGKAIMRCHSARTHDRKRLTRSLALLNTGRSMEM